MKIKTEGPPYVRGHIENLKRQAISTTTDDILAQGINQPSCSPWAFPINLVPKPDSSIRFLWINESVTRLAKRIIILYPRSLRLWMGCRELVDPADCEKVAFGLANGPSHFQLLMDLGFWDLLGICVMV